MLDRLTRIIGLLLAIGLTGCEATEVPTIPSELGEQATWDEMLMSLEQPGLISFQKYKAGDWSVPLSAVLNLEHPIAVAAELKDKPEPVQIYVYTLVHPVHGTFIVDSGLAEGFAIASDNPDISFWVKKAMDIPALALELTTRELKESVGGIDGVFLTHIHLDHIMGLRDLDKATKVYVGPGDAQSATFLTTVMRSSTDNLLSNVAQLNEWQFGESGVIDIFGDGSVWAIHSPGHSPGSTAYLANTDDGPQLLIGDVTHTCWGWVNGVEPGSFSDDGPMNALSLARLNKLTSAHPKIRPHPGHQTLESCENEQMVNPKT